MAKLFFSMSGEGRGHATRVRAVVDELRGESRIRIYAPGEAHNLLAPAYQDSEVVVHKIPGLRFFYTADHRLDTVKTAVQGARYLSGYRGLRQRLERAIERSKPDVIITDFEPALPRAAKKVGVPFISLNHQHFLLVNDLSMLPSWLRRQAWLMSLVVRNYYSGMARTIVSSFYFPPLKAKYHDVVQVGVILRPSVVATERCNDGHLVAYLRKFAPQSVLDALAALPMPVRLYGIGKREPLGKITFCEINEESFLRDLGSCEALISTAGNQLVGEALYLGKPVLAMPEKNNFEQYINAFFLQQEGTGEWLEMEDLTPKRIDAFLGRLDQYRSRINADRYNGTPLAIATIREFLSSQTTKGAT